MRDSQESTETLRGSLGSITIQDLMGFLASVRATGALTVSAPEGEIVIYWEDGWIVWSDPVRGGLDADGLLLESDRFTPDEIDAAKHDTRKSDTGYALVDSGQLTMSELKRFRVELVSENIYRMFEWSPGSFRFAEGDRTPDGVQPMRVDVQGLLLEAAHRYDEWNRLPAAYSAPETCFEILAEPKNSDKIALSLDEWRMLYLVNSCKNLGEIWALSSLASDIETSRIVYGLASAKLIRPVPPEEAEERDSGDVWDMSSGVEPTFTGAMQPPSGFEVLSGGDDQGDLTTLKLTKKGEPEPAGEEPPPQAPLAGPPTEVRRLSRSQIQVESACRLVELVDDGEEPRALELGDAEVTIGRAPDNVLVLVDKHVSGRHARISRDGDHYVVEDLGSANGLRVDGKPVTRVFLRAGSEIEIYPFTFRFERRVTILESGAVAQASG